MSQRGVYVSGLHGPYRGYNGWYAKMDACLYVRMSPTYLGQVFLKDTQFRYHEDTNSWVFEEPNHDGVLCSKPSLRGEWSWGFHVSDDETPWELFWNSNRLFIYPIICILVPLLLSRYIKISWKQ